MKNLGSCKHSTRTCYLSDAAGIRNEYLISTEKNIKTNIGSFVFELFELFLQLRFDHAGAWRKAPCS